MTDWCILRTSRSRTIGLAESLGKDGFESWTPVETRMMVVPRGNVKREVKLPILPGFVFAHANHLIDLIQLAAMSSKPRRNREPGDPPSHADFHVMRCFGKIPVVADRDLANLRRLEEKRRPRKRAPYSFPHGATVKVQGGICMGLLGIVERSNGRVTVLRFGGSHRFEIPTTMLSLKSLDEAA